MVRPAYLPRLLAAVLAGLTADGCRPTPTDGGGDPQLRISQRNEPSDLDPATAALPDDFFIIRALGEGLVFPARREGAVRAPPSPAAAAKWEVSPDGLKWTFHLRPRAVWSNGEPVVAADFVASYRRVLAPATAAPRADLFSPVRNARAYATGRLADFGAVGFHAPDPLTLVVELDRPWSSFLEYAASGPWIPANPRVVARWGRDWTRPAHYVGNGPYRLAEWSPHRRITVRRNPLYRDGGRIRLGSIAFLRFDDAETEDRAYRTGEVDVTMSVPVDKVADYARERPAELHRQALAETRYLSFNLRRPLFGSRDVRRALALALDRRALVAEVLRGNAEAAPRMAAWDDGPADGGLAPDLPESQRLLAAAGYPRGRGFPRLELAAWGGSSGQRVAEAVQRMWENALGVHAALTIREARVHVAAVQAGAYDVALMPLIPWVDDPAAGLSDFTSEAASNYPHWSSPAFDQAVARIETGRDPLLRQASFRSAVGLLEAEVPVIPLYRNVHVWLARPGVSGWEEDRCWNRFYPDLSVTPARR